MIAERFENAPTIELLGYNLRNFWLAKGTAFDEMLRHRLQREKALKVRILLADPESKGLERRELVEDTTHVGRMQADGRAVLNNLADLFRVCGESGLQVRLIDGDLINCSLIFIDDRLFVTWYLGVTGNNCPTVEIQDAPGSLYKVFREEFERLWQRGTQYKGE